MPAGLQKLSMSNVEVRTLHACTCTHNSKIQWVQVVLYGVKPPSIGLVKSVLNFKVWLD